MNADEKKIRRAFKEKNWNAIKTSDSWQIFKIMSEFVEGFDSMSKIGPCVSVFGSARTKLNNKYYKQAEEIAFLLTQAGYGVITGGGPGIMEAANRGATEAKGLAVGLSISLPFEQSGNEWISDDLEINFHYFFMRKFWFLYLAKALWFGQVALVHWMK